MFREQVCRVPSLQIRRNRLLLRVGPETCQLPHSSALAVPPPVNDAAHCFFDGRYHLFDRHVAVSLRHDQVASLLRGPCRAFLLDRFFLLERLFRQVRIPRPARHWRHLHRVRPLPGPRE